MHPPGWIGCPAVHPRVCGERQSGSSGSQTGGGSSPRVRGTLRRLRSLNANFRFIPACAGNASCSRTRRRDFPVHPRVCGERGVPATMIASTVGSSPRVRGTPRERPRPLHRRRFIPACAGNATRAPAPKVASAVHPRVCGERSAVSRPLWSGVGSSPRVRGTRAGVQGLQSGSRFIPACAGNATRRPDRRSGPPVHPRVCGERARLSLERVNQNGSSPRVRGTHSGARPPASQHRFIPACAGNASRA